MTLKHQQSREARGKWELMVVVHEKNGLNILTLQSTKLIEFGLRRTPGCLPQASIAQAASKFPLSLCEKYASSLCAVCPFWSWIEASPSGFKNKQKKRQETCGGMAERCVERATESLSQLEKVKQLVYLSKTKSSLCSRVGKKKHKMLRVVK